MFVRLLEDYQLRPLYKEGMEGTHVRAFQLNALVQEQLPALHRHMEEAGVQPLMYASQWFMALFATDLPLGVVLRVIDVMLVEGADTVLRVALALLRANQDALLKLKFEGMLDHLRHHMYNEAAFRDPSDLIADAFRTRLSERRLTKLEQEGRAHLELTNREKTEMVHLRQERRDAEARARTLEAKLAEAEAENLRIAGELAATKLSLASALASIEDMVRTPDPGGTRFFEVWGVGTQASFGVACAGRVCADVRGRSGRCASRSGSWCPTRTSGWPRSGGCSGTCAPSNGRTTSWPRSSSTSRCGARVWGEGRGERAGLNSEGGGGRKKHS